MAVLEAQIGLLEEATTLELRGSVVEVSGLALRVAGLPAAVGTTVRIEPTSGVIASGGAEVPSVPGEVVGFSGSRAVVMPFDETAGIRAGDRVVAEQPAPCVCVGNGLIGRVIDPMGRPVDGLGPIVELSPRRLDPSPVGPMQRPPLDTALGTGVRAIDALLPVGRGQRLGVFSGPGVGKSTLLGTMARQTSADVSVIAMVGERGREVREFVERTLGPEGLARSVVVVATGDESPLRRVRCALSATTIAEHFRDAGLDVLLIMDSVTRFAQAKRQAGLAGGEPPATRGYPPSVFAALPRLLERTGRTERGSITGFYSVLVEGDDMDDPVADACRGILDGHVVLSRRLAEAGHFPAIDVPKSISRVADDVTDLDHQRARRQVGKLIAAYEEVEDLLNVGAYAPGSNPDYDLAIACKPAIDQLVQQGRSETLDGEPGRQSRAMLGALVERIAAAERELAAAQGRANPASQAKPTGSPRRGVTRREGGR
ncbi:MAG: FliI/YscN family ATPase [Planctomycetota bacterium]